MPKRFPTENTKAVAARERKKQAKEQLAAKKQKDLEESKWKDDNKQLQKKLQRKEAEERKKQVALERKAQTKALLEKEMAETSSKSNKPPPPAKLTRSQIAKSVCETKPKEKEEKKIETHLDGPLFENVNRLHFDGEEARTIDQAIALLSLDPEFVMNPEKKMRAAYAIYEERRVREIKTQNPHMRLSQIRQLIFRQWQRAAENPMNQM